VLAQPTLKTNFVKLKCPNDKHAIWTKGTYFLQFSLFCLQVIDPGKIRQDSGHFQCGLSNEPTLAWPQRPASKVVLSNTLSQRGGARLGSTLTAGPAKVVWRTDGKSISI
jgi:hypothetical protein